MNKYFLLLSIIFSTLSLDGYGQVNCSLKKDDENIKVYLCDSDISDFKTIMVTLEMPATISQYAALALDVEKYKKWQYKVFDQHILKRTSDTEFIYYSAVDTPWPTTNRDMIFHMQLKQDSITKELSVKLTALPDYLEPSSSFVRIQQCYSMLTVTPIDKNHVKVHYIIDIDPGGVVPAWIANLFAAQAPWQTYYNFRQEIISQGEDRITVPFIKDY